MHQKRLEKIFQILECLITEMTETAALIACGTDGGKAIAESFKQNAPYFIFIRCFIHYKGNT